MNTKYMFIVAAMAVMLIGATAFATDDAFADKKKKYGKSQATAQANYCGNGELPLNVWCQNTASQIQGEDNRAAIASSQGPHEESNGPGMQLSDVASTDQQAYGEE
jgi:hypothetical protein